jgi:Kdo2-lipid IVA lauroyltransferase/acyltransferase
LLVYYLLIFLLYPLSLLPLPVLYVAADGLYVLLYYVVRYRRKVVGDNLLHAFPEKSPHERLAIERQFYRNFCDQWMEMLKLLTITREELNRRMPGNWEVFHALNDARINSYSLLGHTFNWEWANVACQWNAPQQFLGVYMPVKNAGVNRLLCRIRTRGGGLLVSMKAKKGLSAPTNRTFTMGLIADQNPSNLKAALWQPFMHREAPFFKGPEQLARRHKGAVVLAVMSKERRGHYRVVLKLFTDDASALPEGEVMKAYVQFLAQQLQREPANWLWSHKRWKHQRPR